MLAKIGIKVNLVVQPKGPHFTLLQKTPPESDSRLLGWGVPTFDSHATSSPISTTPVRQGRRLERDALSNPDTDKSIQGLTEEIDVVKRNAAIARLWSTLSDETSTSPAPPDGRSRHEERPRYPGATGQLGVHEDDCAAK